MDNLNNDNSSEVMLTLQSGFNELIRNSYLQGFRDGREFEQQILKETTSIPSYEKVNYLQYEFETHGTRSLQETEQILSEHS